LGRARLCLLAVAACIVFFQLFLPPSIGLADNGDFPKMTGRFALRPVDAEAGRAYFVARYDIVPGSRWVSDNESSELLFIRAAVSLAGRPFDIRILGVLHAAVFLGALAWFLSGLRPAPATAAGAVIMFSDVAYISMFHSFYTDTAALLFLLLSIVAALTRSTLLFCVFAGLLIASKPQHALLAAVLCPLGLLLPGRRRWAALALPLVAIAVVRAGPPQERTETLFSAIFSKAARDGGDLVQLGLSAGDARYIGLWAYAEGNPLGDPGWRAQFAESTSYARLAIFYLRHPGRVLQIVHDDLKHWGWEIRSETLGNYERWTGAVPYARASAFGWWSGLRSATLRAVPLYPVIWHAAVLAFAWRWKSHATLVCGAISAMAFVELGVTSLADAAETSRHLFLFHALTDLTFVFAIAAAGRALRGGKSLHRLCYPIESTIPPVGFSV
jgi:hypothetical protein